MIPLRDSQPSYSTPVVTAGLIVVNVLAFLYEISLDPFSLNHFIAAYGVIPDRFDPSTLVTSMFLHGGWMHLIGNMWFLWIYGDNVEDILGKAKFLLFYLLSGIAAGLVHVAFNPYSRVPTIGASGAIAGVMGAYMVKFPRSRIVTLVPIFVFLTTVEVPASIILLYWFVIQFFSGLGTIGESHLSQGGVAWFAHVGGFVAGVILIKLFPTRERWRRRPDLHW
ncbi:MAG TPA: rhomboid family intramembrane serine protease [Bryobacteraceae bacterium]|nr:rhomboid family intramembrane serine protease [Bryobacteraceae bacterium]